MAPEGVAVIGPQVDFGFRHHPVASPGAEELPSTTRAWPQGRKALQQRRGGRQATAERH